MNFKLSKQAKLDIENIFEFSVEKWSLNQAKNYYNYIFDEINILCNNPNIGKSISYIKEHHRIWKIKSHIIIYKVKNDIIYIDRILHKRMDIVNVI